MAVYDLHFNKDDVAIRNILIGLLATLNDNIKWINQIGTSVEQKRIIDIPFYFSTTGTERYLQDNFLNNIDFDPEMLTAEAFYNQVPRGIVQFSGFSIETQALVNKYVRMNYLKTEDDGTLNTYNAEAFMVPIIMNIEVEVFVDSILDQLKCSESIIKTFYKAKAYQVDIAYTRIPCLITFPDDQTFDRTVEFSFNDKKEFKVTFALEVKSHIPIFKEGTEIFAGKTMVGFGGFIYEPSSEGTGGGAGGNGTGGGAGGNGTDGGAGGNGTGGTGSTGNGVSGLYAYKAGHIYVPPIIYGSTSQKSNVGSKESQGAIGATYDVGVDAPWPINPKTNFPPKN